MLHDRDYMNPHGPRRQRTAYRPGGGSSVVKTLIIANVVVYVLQITLGLGFTSGLWLTTDALRHFQLWRLFSYMFAHSPTMIFHVLLNMWAVYVFGTGLERRLGQQRFLHLYVLSGLVGGLSWTLFNWQNTTPVLGASGAVFGLLIAAAMMFPDEIIILLFPPIPLRLKTFALVFGGLELLMALNQGGQVAHIAHLGGAVGGWFYIITHANPQWAPFENLLSGLKKKNRKRGTRAPSTRGFSFHPPPKTHEQTSTADGNDEDPNLVAEVDRILDKIGTRGLDSLTKKERDLLNRARERMRQKGGG